MMCRNVQRIMPPDCKSIPWSANVADIGCPNASYSPRKKYLVHPLMADLPVPPAALAHHPAHGEEDVHPEAEQEEDFKFNN